MTWATALAAVVSILAAVTAAFSARRAEQEARSITTLNHKVAALDRQAEQMREDYRDLIKAIGSNTGSLLARFGSIYAAGEVLRAHPQTSEGLSAAIEQLRTAYVGALSGKSELTAYVTDHIESIRGGFRESLAEIERSRSGLLDRRT